MKAFLNRSFQLWIRPGDAVRPRPGAFSSREVICGSPARATKPRATDWTLTAAVCRFTLASLEAMLPWKNGADRTSRGVYLPRWTLSRFPLGAFPCVRRLCPPPEARSTSPGLSRFQPDLGSSLSLTAVLSNLRIFFFLIIITIIIASLCEVLACYYFRTTGWHCSCTTVLSDTTRVLELSKKPN